MSNTDIRLISAYEQIDLGSVKILSIDIFDTLLWRKIPLPTDLFLLMGKQLKSEGFLVEAVTVECFAELRVKSELYARVKKLQQASTMEITIQEIYLDFSGIFTKITIEEMIQGKKGIISEADVSDLINIEVGWEKKLTRFDPNVLHLIRYAAKKGIPIILVSDTYLGHDHLIHILDRPDSILPLIHKIYPSNEYGCGKQQGLFVKILDELDVAPQHILHIGDNLTSDCKAAEWVGIKSLYFPKYDSEMSQIIEREWPPGKLSTLKQQLDDAEGDFGLTALRSKIAYSTETLGMKSKEAFFWTYGATILGPVYAGFIQWIYARCKKLGASRVLCLMREGALYAKLIKELAHNHPEITIEATELWVSRHYIINACISQGNFKELLPLTYSSISQPYTVEKFCSSIGLDIRKLEKIAKYANVKFDDEVFAEKIVGYICSREDLRKEIIEKAAIKRKRFLKYLSSLVNLSEISQIVIVDGGWVGTIQGAIQMILALEGYKITVHGLYLCTERKSHFALMQGFIREGFLIKAGFPSGAAKEIQRGYNILEQMATAGFAPFSHIDENGCIVQRPNVIPKKQQQQAMLMHQGISAFCAKLETNIQQGNVLWPAESESLALQIRLTLLRLTGRPTSKEAKQLCHWHHDSRSDDDFTQTLGNDQYYEKFIGNMIPELAYADPAIYWPGAYLSQFDPYAGLAGQAAHMELLPYKSFQSHDLLPLNVFIDFGKGFSKKAAQVVEMRSNANRRFYTLLKLFSADKPIRRIKLEISNPPSFILIESLRLSLSCLNGVDPAPLVFFESKEETSGIEMVNGQPLGHNFFLCQEKSFSLTCPMKAVDVYSIYLRFCFATMDVKSLKLDLLPKSKFPS